MQQQLQARLAQLREEFESGQQVLAELERRHTEVSNTLQRIGGAIQVLEELLASEAPDSAAA
ncbi:MAG TPA: hypothetical protein VLC08_10045 [Chitinolyticbacter sp.]|uniref:hypothetical protein n=1 Tax=Chitinolyticbacter albus TaxID=2961951 RepID=UPI002108C829|nr:hypothetical protein [Chitinolyticbacter albus]HSC80685.1 hypothetical protein [Chitinolyticbacter sp.]